MEQKKKQEANAEFEKMWTQLEGARIERERNTRPQPEDKCKPLFKKGREGYQTFYVDPPRGYQWCCWCLSEYVNAAGYFLLWRRGRRVLKGTIGGELVESEIMAAKDRSVLMRRVEKYQQRGWARQEQRDKERERQEAAENNRLRWHKTALRQKHDGRSE